MEKEYVVYQSKGKQLGLSLLGLFMVLMSIFVFIAGIMEARGLWLFTGIGLIGLLFFGLCELYIIKQLFVGKKLVVVTPEGFYDFSSATSTKDQMIPWNQVARIENKSILNQSFVSVYLKEPEQFLANVSTLQRKAIAANVKMGFGEININLQSAKKCTNDQLIAKMNCFIEEKP